MAKILIIDDDAVIRTAMGVTLGNAGYHVSMAADGREGLKQHHASPANLIITDLFMPEQEGIETITSLRRNSPRVPILAISGEHAASLSMLAVATELGAAQVLQKPFDTETLLFTVKKLLGGE